MTLRNKLPFFTKIDPDLRAAMRRYKAVVGMPESQQIDRALREWLADRPEAWGRANTMKAPQRDRRSQIARPSFAEVWARIGAHAGEPFTTIRGLAFTYRMDGNGFVPSRTDYRISQGEVEAAFRRVPLSGPGAISDLRGPTYVWAILHDSRISGGAW